MLIETIETDFHAMNRVDILFEDVRHPEDSPGETTGSAASILAGFSLFVDGGCELLPDETLLEFTRHAHNERRRKIGRALTQSRREHRL